MQRVLAYRDNRRRQQRLAANNTRQAAANVASSGNCGEIMMSNVNNKIIEAAFRPPTYEAVADGGVAAPPREAQLSHESASLLSASVSGGERGAMIPTDEAPPSYDDALLQTSPVVG